MNDGEYLAYRVSKAALNQVTVTLAKEWQRNGDEITAIALHPGYVATRMTQGRFRNEMVECIAGIVKVVENTTFGQTGTFVNWLGEPMPW